MYIDSLFRCGSSYSDLTRFSGEASTLRKGTHPCEQIAYEVVVELHPLFCSSL